MRIVKTLATVLALSFAAAPALAAPTPGAPLGQAAAKKGKGKAKDRGPGKRFERAGISKEKMQKIKAVIQTNKTKRKAIREETRKHRQPQKKQRALRESEKKEIAKILTPKEMAKLLGGGRMRGPGRRGGDGPRGNGDFDD